MQAGCGLSLNSLLILTRHMLKKENKISQAIDILKFCDQVFDHADIIYLRLTKKNRAQLLAEL